MSGDEAEVLRGAAKALMEALDPEHLSQLALESFDQAVAIIEKLQELWKSAVDSGQPRAEQVRVAVEALTRAHLVAIGLEAFCEASAKTMYTSIKHVVDASPVKKAMVLAISRRAAATGPRPSVN